MHNSGNPPRSNSGGEVTSQKVRASIRIGDKVFPESLMVCNGFLASRRMPQSSRSVWMLNNEFMKGRDFVGFGETINKVVPEGNAQFPTCFLAPRCFMWVSQNQAYQR